MVYLTCLRDGVAAYRFDMNAALSRGLRCCCSGCNRNAVTLAQRSAHLSAALRIIPAHKLPSSVR